MDSTGSKVRIGHSLNEGERQHVDNRRGTVQKCLQQHGIPCALDEVPNIAVLGSGGGERAMIGLLGSLSQLCEEGLLDCIMYLSGVSGSTWCMASVYKEPDWSTKMEMVKQDIIQKLVNGKVTYTEQYNKLLKMCERDNFSLTDVWALFYVSTLLNEIDELVLTDQRGQHTKDPYPIYTVVDKNSKHDKLLKDAWFEITPDECGYSLTGAFVDSMYLGSQFENGAKTKEHPENDMLYLQGLCGSAVADEAANIKAIIDWLRSFLPGKGSDEVYTDSSECTYQEIVMITLLELNLHFFSNKDFTNDITKMNELLKGKHDKEGNEVKLERPITEEILKDYTLKVCDCLFDWFPEEKALDEQGNRGLTTSEPQLESDVSLKGMMGGINVIAKCLPKVLWWDWGTTYNFLYNMTADDVHPSVFKSKTRKYVDTAVILNSPFVSGLRKERNIDLVISLDFSEKDQFETLKTGAKIFKDLQIPFPTIKHPGRDEEPEDFYVFNDNPAAPTVIHIPLFNAGNCKGEVAKWQLRYQIVQPYYGATKIKDLLEKSGLNIKNTKEKLLKEIQKVIKRKKP